MSKSPYSNCDVCPLKDQTMIVGESNCNELNNIDIMIDDSEDYGKYFNTPYMKINVKI